MPSGEWKSAMDKKSPRCSVNGRSGEIGSLREERKGRRHIRNGLFVKIRADTTPVVGNKKVVPSCHPYLGGGGFSHQASSPASGYHECS